LSCRAIENLIATYAELVDDGDFAGLGALLADTTFRRCPAWRCSPSSAAVIVTASNAATGSGASPNGAFSSISSAT